MTTRYTLQTFLEQGMPGSVALPSGGGGIAVLEEASKLVEKALSQYFEHGGALRHPATLETSLGMSQNLATVEHFWAWRSNPTYSGFKAPDAILG